MRERKEEKGNDEIGPWVVLTVSPRQRQQQAGE